MKLGRPSAFGRPFGFGRVIRASGSTPTPTPGPVVPVAPNVTVTPGNGQNSISWTDGAAGSSPITGHKVYSSTVSGFTPTPGNVIASPTGASPYVHTGIANGTQRFYRVTAVSDAGESQPSAELSGNPAAGGQTANQALLSALPAQPYGVAVPGSRQRQNYIQGTSAAQSGIDTSSAGDLEVWRSRNRRFRNVVYYNSARAFNIGGLNFASDGSSINFAYSNFHLMVGSILKGKGFVIVTLSSNGLQLDVRDIFGTTVGTNWTVQGYLQPFQDFISACISNGIAVFCEGLWERNVSAGGVWSAGGVQRTSIPAINAQMKAWCDTQGVPFHDPRPYMIDFNDTARNPLAGVTRDGTHLSAIGADLKATGWEADFGPYLPSIEPQYTTNNILQASQSAMSGTAGTLSGANLTGQLADGFTATHATDGGGALNAVIVASKATLSDGKPAQQFSFDTSAMAAGTSEGVTVTLPVTGLTVGTWYAGSLIAELDAWDAWAGLPALRIQSGAAYAGALVPINEGQSQQYSPDNRVQTGPKNVARRYLVEIMPFQAATTTATVTIRIYNKVGTGIGRVRFGSLVLAPWTQRGFTDPKQLMYDPATNGQAVSVTGTTLTVPEEADYPFQLVANQPGKFTWSGADAAQFVSRSGSANNAFGIGFAKFLAADFEDPNHSASYTTTYTFTPVNPNNPAVTGALSATVTNIQDGTLYTFTGADGTDIADLYPGVARLSGVSGGLAVTSNACRNTTAGQGTLTTYAFPQEGDTVNTEVRWRMTSSSATVQVLVKVVDANNCIRLSPSGGNLNVQKIIAGAATTIMQLTTSGAVGSAYIEGPGLYTALANGVIIIAQIIDGVLSIYQNSVFVGSCSVAGLFDGTGTQGAAGAPLPASKVTGLQSNLSGGSTNTIDNFNPRPAVALTPKIALKNPTVGSLTGAAGADYASDFTNLVAGEVVTASDSSGLFFVDGVTLRAQAVPAGTYTITLTKAHPNAVNSGSTSTLTITIS